VTTSRGLGPRLHDLLATASSDVLICAPFIKRHAVREMLPSIERGLGLNVFTRWRPEEVAAGVSDPLVLLDIQERGGKLWLCDRLHAKLYAADRSALVGSANVTGAALGWSASPNLEILTSVPRGDSSVAALEAALKAESVPASRQVMEQVIEAARLFEPPERLPEPEDSQQVWLPQLRIPEDLFVAYVRGPDSLASGSANAARLDLSVLDLPSGLDREGMKQVIRTRMLQRRELIDLGEFLREPRRFGEVRAWLQERLNLDRDEAEATWQAVMRWLLYFLPDMYGRAVPRHSEIIVRVGEPG